MSDRAVSIARPVNTRISLVTLVSDPELHNQFAAPMLKDLREVMQEETQDFIDKLNKETEYLIGYTFVIHGALNEHILDVCRKHVVNLVIYGSHNHSFSSCASCSAKSVIHTSQVDVLLVPSVGD